MSDSGHRGAAPLGAPGKLDPTQDARPECRVWSVPCARGEGRHQNVIITWLVGAGVPPAEFLRRLITADDTLGAALGETYAINEKWRRLGLTLFMEFAKAHELSAAELAMLMVDAQAEVDEALAFVLSEAARAEDAAVRSLEPPKVSGQAASGVVRFAVIARARSGEGTPAACNTRWDVKGLVP